MMTAPAMERRLDVVIGAAAATLKRSSRQFETVGDLLRFLPRRYLDVGRSGRFAEHSPGDHAVLVARVQTMEQRRMANRRGSMAIATLVDDEGTEAGVTFFSSRPHYSVLRPGTSALFSGELGVYRGRLELKHPQYVLSDSDDLTAFSGSLLPVYPHVERLSNLKLALAMRAVLDAVGAIEDPLSQELRDRHDLLSLDETYRALHFPAAYPEVQRARERLRFDEAFETQIVLAQRRREARAVPGVARVASDDGLLAAFDARLPFELTDGQREVGEAITADLASSTPMHRLLQGEVGSGKTVVALRAMLTVVDAGAQAALLAPTEVLAAQHAASIRAMLGELAGGGGLFSAASAGTAVTLLTGSMSQSARSQAMLDIVSGQAGIVVGTHALLQKHVEFADLGLVVVDEQHRFGVEQRAALNAKAQTPPHVLVMTATPIPRTVAMTAFGDLDVSTLRQLPRGRAPIVSHVVPAGLPAWMNRVWERLAEECRAGRQAYVVTGRIGGGASAAASETEGAGEPAGPLQPLGAVELLADMRGNPALADLSIDLMHGRMPAADKNDVMTRFAAGEVNVLVATTVIEVGVDVPNASMIVIMDADRFGLSQLHQLRGRVGRGSSGGLCLLVTRSEDAAVHERLRRVAETTDGFAIADLDLELRREGDVLGAAQSGTRKSLEWLELTRAADLELIERAREEAVDLVEADPALKGYPLLADLTQRRVNSEQAEFLERG